MKGLAIMAVKIYRTVISPIIPAAIAPIKATTPTVWCAKVRILSVCKRQATSKSLAIAW